MEPLAQGELRVAPDERWWPAVAAQVCGLAGAGAPVCDLRAVTVLVASLRQAADLRAALHAALQGRACLAPRILTLQAWAGFDPDRQFQQRAELFEALRRSSWVRERFGAQPGALWALARDLAQLGDELTLAACGADDAFEGRWRAAVQRNFSARAAAAAEPQTQLVLALWRAGLSADSGAAGLRARLEQRARQAAGPLVWLAPSGAEPWQASYCRAYAAASGQPALLIAGDLAALVERRPWLCAAWPELARAEATVALAPAEAPPLAPIAERARILAATLAAAPDGGQGHARAEGAPIGILRCESLEQEAAAAAQWTLDRLREGAASVALVALDRLTARRTRALLERAAVLVADESGWKLSTTSAAAAVMRWLDLAGPDLQAADLLDWMHSPFALSVAADRQGVLAALQQALLDAGVLHGRKAIVDALARRARARPDDAAAAAALLVLQDLLELAREWRQADTLGRFLGLLEASLDRLAMRPALQSDAVGQEVLLAIEQLHEVLVGSTLRLDLAEFRALLAEHFEQSSLGRAGERGVRVQSPVVMTTLAATQLRRFDAALLVGADAERLPGSGAAGALMADAVRRELGLPGELERRRRQAHDLAGLVALCGRVDATWRARMQDEPRPLSPLLDRLAMVAGLAGRPSPIVAAAEPAQQVAARVSAVRAPAAAALTPARISASAYQDLVDCPYRFFARHMLGLRETGPVPARPDKRDLGLLLHAVLFEYHRGERDAAGQGPPGEAASRRREQDRLRAIIDARFAPLLAQRPALLGYRQRLRSMVPGYLAWQAQARGQGWHWLRGETTLERAVTIGHGLHERRIVLQGRIDRIDSGANGAQRLLDYKARDSVGLRQAQRDAGEEVQLLFYALLADPPPEQAAYLTLRRPPDPADPAAGVVELVDAPAPLQEHAAALQADIVDTLGRVADGAALPALGADAVCRRCELRCLCRYGFTAAREAPAGPAAEAAQ